MTIKDAIEDLEARKAFLKRTCPHCWDPAIELALIELKERYRYLENPMHMIRKALDLLWCRYEGIDSEFIEEIISQIEDRMHAE